MREEREQSSVRTRNNQKIRESHIGGDERERKREREESSIRPRIRRQIRERDRGAHRRERQRGIGGRDIAHRRKRHSTLKEET